MLKNLIFVCALSFCAQGFGKGINAQSNIIQIDGHPLHIATWGQQDNNEATIVLLSGPIDSLFSDSAWWSTLGPKLAKTHRVIAIDRAGIATQEDNAQVVYQHFAKDIHFALDALHVKNATIVAFSSSNIALQFYLASQPEQSRVRRVIMVDPDVLTDYSIARYKEDAKTFKDNIDEYLVYVSEGKYIARVEQKNAGDMALLKKLIGDNTHVDWLLVEKMFKARLDIAYQKNLFREMAIYGQELDAAAELVWPMGMPLTIVDTDFESVYAANIKDAETKAGILHWAQNGQDYYKRLVARTNQGNYIQSKSPAHLFQVAETESFAEIIRLFETNTITGHNK